MHGQRPRSAATPRVGTSRAGWRTARSVRVPLVATVVTVLALSGLSAPARGAAPTDPVSEWNQIAVSTLVALPAPAGGAPPATQILMGMTQGAVYDAVY